MIEQSISHYHIVKKLGAGGMGEVYLAEDTQLGRRVALKFLPADVASDEGPMRRFIQEARAASALNHPNILTVYEFGEAESIYFIATEFIDGVTLRKRMQREPMKVSLALDVAVQTTEALAAAHGADIVHRDIKPENIMLRADGYIKVLDFGLAKLTERRAAQADAPTLMMTDAGVVMGTAKYMSPEQARGLPVDARTDIWSVGVVIYEMVTSARSSSRWLPLSRSLLFPRSAANFRRTNHAGRVAFSHLEQRGGKHKLSQSRLSRRDHHSPC